MEHASAKNTRFAGELKMPLRKILFGTGRGAQFLRTTKSSS
jgi:hypothetical protein